MRYDSSRWCPGRAGMYITKTLNALEAKKCAVKSELNTITYDSFSESVRSLSGFFGIYSVVLILLLVAILASSFI